MRIDFFVQPALPVHLSHCESSSAIAKNKGFLMLRKSLLVVFFAHAIALGDPPQSPKHLNEARNLLQTLKPGNSKYGHEKLDVKWQGEDNAAASVCFADCSYFLDALLAHSYPKYNAEALNRWFGSKKRPLAKHYYETITAKKGFSRISKIGDVRAGDIIAIRYLVANKDKDTGHTMLVVGTPKERTASAMIINETVQWEVPIMDMTRTGHGKRDSRLKSNGEFSGGLGTGFLRIYATKDGTLAGYSWSFVANSGYHEMKDRPIAIGRLDPKFEP
jgi:hypothetical protein